MSEHFLDILHNRYALDRHITGNYGEDQFKDCGQYEFYDPQEPPSPDEGAWRVVNEALRMAVAIIVKEMGDPKITEERAAQMLEHAIDCFLDRGPKE